VAGGILAALLVANQAAAVPIKIEGSWQGSQTVTINAPAISSNQVNAGGFKVSIDNGPSVLAWCADLLTTISFGNTYEYSGPSTLVGTAANNLAKLASNALGTVTSQVTAADKAAYSAAFQLAIWEILYEGSPSAVDTGTGFKVSVGPSSVGIANGWLGSLAGWENGQNYAVDFYQKDGTPPGQDLVLFRRVPVPEPGSFALMLVGVAGAGLLVLRKRMV
jgi:hypothetical protein